MLQPDLEMVRISSVREVLNRIQSNSASRLPNGFEFDPVSLGPSPLRVRAKHLTSSRVQPWTSNCPSTAAHSHAAFTRPPSGTPACRAANRPTVIPPSLPNGFRHHDSASLYSGPSSHAPRRGTHAHLPVGGEDCVFQVPPLPVLFDVVENRALQGSAPVQVHHRRHHGEAGGVLPPAASRPLACRVRQRRRQ